MATLALTLLFGGIAAADSAPSAGGTLYRRYCASCHGIDGAGDGPVAVTLSTRPTDLRRLDADVAALMQAIDGRRSIRAHGEAEMPVWGHVLEGTHAGNGHRGRTALHEVQAIAEHVRSLRAR